MTKLELDTLINELAANVGTAAPCPGPLRKRIVDQAYSALIALREALRPTTTLEPMPKETSCAFCPTWSIDPCGDGWEPSYWDDALPAGGDEVSLPVCPKCVRDRLRQDDDGVF
jgi:hypothetical protein